MSLTNVYLGTAGFGFPRVSGDEPQAARDIVRAILFSPRERG